MCFVSVITQHYGDKWNEQWRYNQQSIQPQIPQFFPTPPPPSAGEIKEFRELLDKARAYDKKMKQPHCEQEDKKAALRVLAKKWDIDISFIDQKDDDDPA